MTCPTPRYAHILAAVPPVLVAPLRRVMRAVLVLGAELARCFEKQGLPLPPWRHADAITSKYDAVASVAVHADGSDDGARPAAAAAAVAAAPGVAAAAAARKQQRDQQQLERVQVRLARLGLLQEGPAPDSPLSSEGSGSASPAEGGRGAHAAVDSPRSVLEVRPAELRTVGGCNGCLHDASWRCCHGHDVWPLLCGRRVCRDVHSCDPPPALLECRPGRRPPPTLPSAWSASLRRGSPKSMFVVAGGKLAPSLLGGSSMRPSGIDATACGKASLAATSSNTAARRPQPRDARPRARHVGWPAASFGPVAVM